MTTNKTREKNENFVHGQGQHRLVLYNDDINLYEYVVETLMEVCSHTELQAEQCTFIAHFKGKSVVRVGQLDELTRMMLMLRDKGLQVQIETIDN